MTLPKDQALQAVQEAKKTVLEALTKRGSLPILQKAFLHLNKAEDILVLELIDEKIAEIENVQEKLVEVSNELKEEIEDLKEVAEKIEIVAKAVKLMTDAFKTIV